MVMCETIRLKIYPASQNLMEQFIGEQTDDALKAAYTEMLAGCLEHPVKREWYAVWMIELKDGTHIGELCFKGLDADGVTEIGYGILEEYQGKGYASEAVKAVSEWALQNPNVTALEAEADAENTASQRVLEKCGFIFTGKFGKEGYRYTLNKNF